MKTIRQWFEQAKEKGYEWADAALDYAQNNPFLEDSMVDCLQYAVADGFSWEDTEEGEDYWFEVWRKAY